MTCDDCKADLDVPKLDRYKQILEDCESPFCIQPTMANQDFLGGEMMSEQRS